MVGHTLLKMVNFSEKVLTKQEFPYYLLVEKLSYSSAVLPFLSYFGSLWGAQRLFHLNEEEVVEAGKRSIGQGLFTSIVAGLFAFPFFIQSPAKGILAWSLFSSTVIPFVVMAEAVGVKGEGSEKPNAPLNHHLGGKG